MYPASILRSLDRLRLTWPVWLTVGGLIAASLSATALGAAWTWLAAWGLWHALCTHRAPAAEIPPFLRNWFIACLICFSAKALATVYWSDSWQERHGEIRLLLSAAAAYGLFNYFQKISKYRNAVISGVSHALSMTCLLGLAWVIWHERQELTTHPIAWAGVMAMFSCWLLAVSFDTQYSQRSRQLWFLGGFLGVLAVLASQSRGAFVITLWWAGVLALSAWHKFKQSQCKRLTIQRLVCKFGIWAALLVGLAWTPVLERPRAALELGITELMLSLHAPEASSNSSVGSRIYMWQKSVAAIAEAPGLGYGRQGRRQLLNEWAQEAQSTEIARLGHLHNEYLHQLLDHGLLGLVSLFSCLIGLMLVVIQLKRSAHWVASMALGGIWLVHVFGSISNVNFAHNYYTSGLSLMILLIISLLAAKPSDLAIQAT